MLDRKGREVQQSSEREAELVRALARRSEQAMAEIYSWHGGLVYRFSLRMVQDEAIAEEVTQDVFLALLRQSDQFDPAVGKLSTWLCGIARRLVWKHLERNRRFEPLDSSDASELESPEADPGTLYDRQRLVLAVRKGIDELPSDLKAVLVLCVFEEMSYEHAAESLGLPIGTVRSRLHRAKHRLALLLGDEKLNPDSSTRRNV